MQMPDYVPEDHPEYSRYAMRGIGRVNGFRDFVPEVEAAAIREVATQEQPPEVDPSTFLGVKPKETVTCEFPGCGKQMRETGYRMHLLAKHKIKSFAELEALLNGENEEQPEEPVSEDADEPEDPAEDEPEEAGGYVPFLDEG